MPRGTPSRVGDTMINKNGYHNTRTTRGWRLTHHIIAERKLGRPLRSDETARFANGDRTNLDPDNIIIAKRRIHPRRQLETVEAHISELKEQRQRLLTELQGSN